jgi:hypothetical protein
LANAYQGWSPRTSRSGSDEAASRPAEPSRSNRASGFPLGERIIAELMCSFRASSRSVPSAACESPNASAAVLLRPTTSASRPRSLTSRCRAVRKSSVTNTAHANSSEAALATMLTAVSFRASDRRAIQSVMRRIIRDRPWPRGRASASVSGDASVSTWKSGCARATTEPAMSAGNRQL